MRRNAIMAKHDTPTKAYMPISKSDMARNVLIRSLSINVGVFALGGSFFGIRSALGTSLFAGKSAFSTIFPKPLPSPLTTAAVVMLCGVLSVGLIVVTVVAAAYVVALVALVAFPIHTTCGWRDLVDGIVEAVVGGSFTVL